MSLLGNLRMAALAARAMQGAAGLGARRTIAAAHERWPELPRTTRALRIPTSVGTAAAVVYLPATNGPSPVHVNFHGGGYVLPLTELDDPLCRYLAAEAGVAELLDSSRNRGESDLEALAAGRPQQLPERRTDGPLLFRIGDAVAGRNIHAAMRRLALTL
jgi:hypothetical protein